MDEIYEKELFKEFRTPICVWLGKAKADPVKWNWYDVGLVWLVRGNKGDEKIYSRDL